MAVGALTEEVALNLEEAAAATRRINAGSVSMVLGGILIGASLGFYFGSRWNREKIRAEAFAESEREVESIRELYKQKETARQMKPPVEDLMREKGYSEEEIVEHVVDPRPLKPPVPVQEPPTTRTGYSNVTPGPHPIVKRTEEGEKDKNDGWSYPYELSNRTPDRPYIIHQDEFKTNETDYQQVVYTYYEGDDTFTDEHDTVLENVDNLIGLSNLDRWGHGSDDIDVLYIRNSYLELEIERCRTPSSYEEVVLGMENSEDVESD